MYGWGIIWNDFDTTPPCSEAEGVQFHMVADVHIVNYTTSRAWPWPVASSECGTHVFLSFFILNSWLILWRRNQRREWETKPHAAGSASPRWVIRGHNYNVYVSLHAGGRHCVPLDHMHVHNSGGAKRRRKKSMDCSGGAKRRREKSMYCPGGAKRRGDFLGPIKS